MAINLRSVLPGIGGGLGRGISSGIQNQLAHSRKKELMKLQQEAQRDIQGVRQEQALEQLAARSLFKQQEQQQSGAQKFLADQFKNEGGIGNFLRDTFQISSPEQRILENYQRYQQMQSQIGMLPGMNQQQGQFGGEGQMQMMGQAQQQQASPIQMLAQLPTEVQKEVLDQLSAAERQATVVALDEERRNQQKKQDQALRQIREQEDPTSIPQSIAQGVGSVATGLGSTAAGLASGGELANFALSGLQILSNYLPDIRPEGLKQLDDPEFRDERRKHFEEVMAQSEPGTPEYEDAKMYKEGFERPEKEFLEAVKEVVPSGKNIRKLGKYITKDTPVYDYLWPKTKAQKVLHDIGKLGGYAMSGKAGNAYGMAKNVFKALGVGSAAKALGLGTEYATGSKTAGKIASGLGVMAYNIVPGTFRQVGSKKYKEVDKIFKGAEDKGFKIRGKEVEPLYKNLAEDARKNFLPQSESAGTLSPYLNRLQNLSKATQGEETPTALWNFAKELNKDATKYAKSNPQVERFLLKMKDGVMDTVESTLNNIKPGAASLLKDANSLWKTAHDADRVAKQIGGLSRFVNVSPLSMLYFLPGGFKLMIGGKMLGMGASYLKKVLENPAMQKEIGRLMSASASNNIPLMGKQLERMNKISQKTAPKLENALSKGLARYGISTTS